MQLFEAWEFFPIVNWKLCNLVTDADVKKNCSLVIFSAIGLANDAALGV
jgi:hypothetical protein